MLLGTRGIVYAEADPRARVGVHVHPLSSDKAICMYIYIYTLRQIYILYVHPNEHHSTLGALVLDDVSHKRDPGSILVVTLILLFFVLYYLLF